MEWKNFVKQYYNDHPNLTYSQAMKEASKHYKKKVGGLSTQPVPAVYQRASDISTPVYPRDINIVAGRKKKGAGIIPQTYLGQPNPEQVKLGGVQYSSRGESGFDTEEAIKGGRKKRGAGVGSTIAHTVGNVANGVADALSFFGLGAGDFGNNCEGCEEEHSVVAGRKKRGAGAGLSINSTPVHSRSLKQGAGVGSAIARTVGTVASTLGDALEIFGFGKDGKPTGLHRTNEVGTSQVKGLQKIIRLIKKDMK